MCALGPNSVHTRECSVGFPCSFALSNAKLLVSDFIPSHLSDTSRKHFSRTQVKSLDVRATVSYFFSLRAHILGVWVSSTSSSFARDNHLWNGKVSRV